MITALTKTETMRKWRKRCTLGDRKRGLKMETKAMLRRGGSEIISYI